MEYDVVKSLVVVIILGFVIGMQRSMTYLYKGEQPFAGSRTFALLALAGYVSGWLQKYVPGFAVASLVVVGSLIALSYFMKVKNAQKRGMTTQVAALVTFLLGLMVWFGLQNYAIFIGVVTVILLEIKPKLQKIEAHISSTDINAVVLLLAMSFVLLPILPDEMLGPYNLFNPYKTWLMAVIIATISFVGYIAIKVFGQKHGVFLTGAAGGLIASTAVTISLSKMFSKRFELVNNYAGGIAIACTFMYFRVLLEVFVIDSDLAGKLAPAFLGAAFSGLLFVYLMYKNSSSVEIDIQNSALTKNPLQLSEAVKFGLLFGAIYGAVAFVETRYGDIGVYVVSLFSGLTDVDAITLSLSQMAKDQKLAEVAAMNGIVIASVTNSLVKLAIVFWLGGAKLGWKLFQFFALTLGVMLAALILTERFIF